MSTCFSRSLLSVNDDMPKSYFLAAMPGRMPSNALFWNSTSSPSFWPMALPRSTSMPMIVVPYPHAGGHQRANAKVLADGGAAQVVEDADFDAAALLDAAAILDDPSAHLAMSAAARALGRQLRLGPRISSRGDFYRHCIHRCQPGAGRSRYSL